MKTKLMILTGILVLLGVALVPVSTVEAATSETALTACDGNPRGPQQGPADGSRVGPRDGRGRGQGIEGGQRRGPGRGERRGERPEDGSGRGPGRGERRGPQDQSGPNCRAQ